MRSAARAHLSQLIDMFGTDGRLIITTAHAPSRGDSAQESGPEDDDTASGPEDQEPA